MRHAWQRALLVAVVAVLALSTVAVLGSGLAAAQEAQPEPGAEPVNNSTIDNIEGIEGQLGSVDVLRVSFEDGNLVRIVVDVQPGAGPIAVTDSGAVDISSNERAQVPFEVYRIEPGVHELRFYLSSDDELITIQEGEQMMAASGERDVIDILANPTAQDVQAGALGGATTVILGAMLSAGIKKRRHHNTYKELLSEERVRVEEDTVDGILGRVTRFIRHHRYALLAAAATVAYLTAVAAGIAPSPGDAWAAMSDWQRVYAAAVTVLFLPGFIAAYIVVSRVWDPATEFVIDTDARDIIDSALGAKGGLAALEDVEDADDIDDAVETLEEDDITVTAVYSGSPERVSQLRCEGEPAELQTAGGRGYLVQDFDPAQNTAEGVWPGLADDFELARNRSKIDSNREILEDYATVGRRIIGALPAIRAGADTSAVTAVDRKFAEAAVIDSDPVDDIMDSAVSGTRFERYYSKDTGEDDGEEYSGEEDEDDDVVNDGGDEE